MSEASKTSVDDAEAKVQAKFQAGAGAGPRPHQADPTPVRPKTPAPKAAPGRLAGGERIDP